MGLYSNEALRLVSCPAVVVMSALLVGISMGIWAQRMENWVPLKPTPPKLMSEDEEGEEGCWVSGWPSGLRRQTQGCAFPMGFLVSAGGVGSNPTPDTSVFTFSSPKF